MDGYIKLHRKCLENEFFSELPFDRWRAFEWLLFQAKYKPTKILVKGQIVKLETGQLLVSDGALCQAWGWSRSKVRRYMKLLESESMIRINGTALGTVVTIENYTKYQGGDTTGDTTGDTPLDTPPDTTGDTHIKKDKKDKKDKNNYIYNARTRHADGVSKFTPPSIQEVKAYCIERGNSVDPEVFIDFYESKGWMVGTNKMKDWRAAVRNWERNRASKSANQETTKGRLDWIDDI